jgi:fructokinase
MNNSCPIVVGIGEVLWDLLPAGRQIGGAPANFAYHACMLGADAYVLSSVGNDEHGRDLLAKLDRFGIHRRFVQIDPIRPTSTVSIELDDQGKPTYVIHENVAWDHIGYSPELSELAYRADVVCFGSLAQRSPVSRASIRRFLDATCDNCLRIFDINLRAHYYDVETIALSLRSADVLKLNDEELHVVAGLLGISGDEQGILDGLMANYDLQLIALTRGADGALLFSRDGRSAHPGIRTDVVDTIGAGDAFTAALAMGMIRHDELDTINQRACQLASYVCSRSGAMPELPRSLHSSIS